jgi:tRNA-splicing endonuclease subunit Sen54
MDEALELPSAAAQKPAEDAAEDNNQDASDDEDGGLDWTKLLYEPL